MFDPSRNIQDYLVFGEFGDVNPSITDSSTFTFLSPSQMEEAFEHDIEGCFLYSRHWNPTNKYLARALAAMEDTEAAQVTASGMAAISSAILQICKTGDEIISERTIYGGSYAFLKNFLPRLGIKVTFVDIRDIEKIRAAITEKTKVIYAESLSNPLLEIADLPAISALAHEHDIKFIVDNTFTPMIISPKRLGADIVVHSMTKFINGTSDCVAGCICATQDFVNELVDVNTGATMLLGPVLDSTRAASILKNIHSLHIRMKQHSKNALYVAENLQQLGVRVFYPGLSDNPSHELMKKLMNPQFGFGGMLAIDAQTSEEANALMGAMQESKVGYLAVSLGYFKTLFSAPGHSTSSEIPHDERDAMGLSDGLVRISIGLDNDIETSLSRIKACLERVGLC